MTSHNSKDRNLLYEFKETEIYDTSVTQLKGFSEVDRHGVTYYRKIVKKKNLESSVGTIIKTYESRNRESLSVLRRIHTIMKFVEEKGEFSEYINNDMFRMNGDILTSRTSFSMNQET